MTVRLTDLGRSWLAPWQRRLAYEEAEVDGLRGHRPGLPYDMFKLYFPAQGMVLWVTQPEFERSH